MNSVWRSLNGEPTRLLFWAIFRVYLALHLGSQIVSYFFLRDVLFSVNSFIPLSSIGYARFLQEHIVLFLLGYLLLVFAMALGVGRNVTVFLVFVATKSLQTTNSYILNGGHNFLTFLLLYMSFADSFRYLVLNRSNRARSDSRASLFAYTTNIATACVIIHLAVIYFVSGLAKAHADVWYHGNALYYIFLVERFQGLPWNAGLAQKGSIVTGITYGVMLWELYFPVLIWIPKLRAPVLLAGVLMHIGICVSMMLWDFEILFIMSYGFFLRDEQLERVPHRLAVVWRRLGEKLQLLWRGGIARDRDQKAHSY